MKTPARAKPPRRGAARCTDYKDESHGAGFLASRPPASVRLQYRMRHHAVTRKRADKAMEPTAPARATGFIIATASSPITALGNCQAAKSSQTHAGICFTQAIGLRPPR